MSEPQPYPAWVEGVVVQNAEEEAAVREGRAVLEETVSAHGNTLRIKSITPKPEPVVTFERPAKKPDPSPKKRAKGTR
jgi:hypothetical protein